MPRDAKHNSRPSGPTLVVYCEKAPFLRRDFIGERGLGTDAVLDVSSVADLAAVGATNRLDERSLLRFDASRGYEKRGTFVEGRWYQLPIESLGLKLVEDAHIGEGGTLLFRGELASTSTIDASRFRIKPRYYVPRQTLRQRYRLPAVDGPMKLVVADCGQGNWNEILTPEARILFDTGADAHWQPPRVRTFLRERGLAGETRPIHAILSHWDVDHYHALLAADPKELASIKSLVAPDFVPDTATCRRTLDWLQTNSVPVRLLPPSPRRGGAGNRTTLEPMLRSGPLTLFRATKGSNRNTTGIVVHVQGEQMAAMLTGDHRHAQVFDALRREGLTQSPTFYVVPHHGGQAGKLDASTWAGTLRDAAISFGSGNQYGHPLGGVERALRRMWIQPHRTATDGNGEWRL